MWVELRNLFRGLALLRHSEVIKSIGEERLHRLQLAQLRTLAPELRLSNSLKLIGYKQGLLQLGRGVCIREDTVLGFGYRADGLGRISIGPATEIGEYNNLRAGGGDIRIGSNCVVSQFCSIIASNHAHVRGASILSQGDDPNRRGVIIGDDVWLGSGCAVMPGVSIGDGAIIGANAVVTHDVAANEIWAGIPARKIGERE